MSNINLRGLIAFSLLVVSSGAGAAERGYSVTDFDRVDVSGPFSVTVETGKSPSARAIGSSLAIDRLKVETRGRTLVIRPGTNGWGGWPGEKQAAPTVRITVPMLRGASLTGSGSLRINKMRAQSVQITNSGSGQMTVSQLQSDRLFATLYGSGSLTLGGATYSGAIKSEGSGNIDGKELTLETLDLNSSSAGTVTLVARRTAKVISTGSGTVKISGNAACTVSAIGSGDVSCGKATGEPIYRP